MTKKFYFKRQHIGRPIKRFDFGRIIFTIDLEFLFFHGNNNAIQFGFVTPFFRTWYSVLIPMRRYRKVKK